MRVYKQISFCEGISCTLAEFKKDFAPHLKKLSEKEIKEAHKAATKGNIKKEDVKFPRSTGKRKKTNTSESK